MKKIRRICGWCGKKIKGIFWTSMFGKRHWHPKCHEAAFGKSDGVTLL